MFKKNPFNTFLPSFTFSFTKKVAIILINKQMTQ